MTFPMKEYTATYIVLPKELNFDLVKPLDWLPIGRKRGGQRNVLNCPYKSTIPRV